MRKYEKIPNYCNYIYLETTFLVGYVDMSNHLIKASFISIIIQQFIPHFLPIHQNATTNSTLGILRLSRGVRLRHWCRTFFWYVIVISVIHSLFGFVEWHIGVVWVVNSYVTVVNFIANVFVVIMFHVVHCKRVHLRVGAVLFIQHKLVMLVRLFQFQIEIETAIGRICIPEYSCDECTTINPSLQRHLNRISLFINFIDFIKLFRQRNKFFRPLKRLFIPTILLFYKQFSSDGYFYKFLMMIIIITKRLSDYIARINLSRS